MSRPTPTPALQNFEIGVRHLGIGYMGVKACDLDAARRAFTAATTADDDMADAWLGRATTGEITREVIWGAYRSFKHLREASTMLPDSLPVGYLVAGMVVPGALVSFPASTYDDLELAQAIMDATDGWYQDVANVGTIPSSRIGDFDEALLKIDSVAHRAPTNPLVPIVRAGLYTITERWPDVQTALRGTQFDDPKLRMAAGLMSARAAVRLGMGKAALDKLKELEESRPEDVSHGSELYWLAAHAHRNQDHEDEARKTFEQCYAHFGEKRFDDAVRNPSLRLAVIRPEQIAARSNPWDAATTPSRAAVEAKANEGRNKELFDEAKKSLDGMIGMNAVKSQIKRLQATMHGDKARAGLGIATSARTHHLIFTGPPGTGKTQISRVVMKLYAGLGVITKPEVVEVTPNDLVAEYIGQTGPKTRAVIDRALGGVLFIDEAYGLAQSRSDGNSSFGKEAVDTLLREMDEHRDNLVVIIAGYEDEIEKLLNVNDGLRSRFAKRIRFETYTPEELVAIAENMISERGGKITDDAKEALYDSCRALSSEVIVDMNPQTREQRQRGAIDVAGNGRFIRNVVEAAETERDLRVLETSEDDPDSITAEQWITIDVPDIGLALMSVRANLVKD